MYGIRTPQTETRVRWPIVLAMFGYTLLVRWVPYLLHNRGVQLDPDITFYPWNFSPAFAVCLFSGAFCTDRKLSAILPVVTFFISDVGIWLLTGRLDWAFYPSQFAVYLCLVIITCLGFAVRQRRSILAVASTGLVGCTLFFLVTNFAVWALGTTYPRTPFGLLECYVAALPYFRNSLLGTAFFGAALFSPFAVREIKLLPRDTSLAR